MLFTFYIVFDEHECINPGVVNRTQSNSNRSIDFDWFRWSKMIELTQNFCQSNKIERSEIEASKLYTNQVSFCFKQASLLLKNNLCVTLSFKLKSLAQMSKKVETAENLKLTILEEMVVIKGYQVCAFTVGVDEKFIVELGVQLIR